MCIYFHKFARNYILVIKRILIILLLFVSVSSADFAQKKARKQVVEQPSWEEKVLESYSDSLYRLRSYYDSVWVYGKDDLLSNPYYYRLFVQPTFYFNPVKQQMDLTWPSENAQSRLSLDAKKDDVLCTDSAMNRFFSSLYVNQPELIVTSQTVLDNEKGIRNDLPKDVEHKVELSSKVNTPKPLTVFEPIQVVGRRPNFWTFRQTYGLQLMQYYFSGNWYKGGDNYNSFLITANISANYNNHSKLTFNNTLSVQLGMQTVKNDTVHPWHSTTDELRMVNQLSVAAAKNWSYTATLTTTTRMTPQYPNNSRKATSDFMSPFETVLSIGMKYNLSKSKFNISVNMAPLSFDLRYVGRKDLATRFGNLANHKYREYYGSNVTINSNWRILNELNWSSRLYYFTNYNKVQVEWENTFVFTINKYLNSKLYLYPRFDDTQYDDNHKHTIQLQQWLSLGFNISF